MSTWKLPHAHPAVPGEGKVLTPADKAFHQYSHPGIWGRLGDQALHNPFRDHDFEEYPEALGHAGHAWAAAYDAHPEYVHAFHERYARNLAASHPVMALPTHVVPQIVHEGRIKSQFEVKPSEKSSSYYDPGGRAVIEHHLFGYPKPEEGFPDEARPLYGHLSAHPYTDTSTSGYGGTSFLLHKPAVWHRSTFSGDDSWGRLGAISGVPLNDYGNDPHSFRHAVPLDHLEMNNRDVDHMSPSSMARRMEERTPEDRADAFWRHGERKHQRYMYPELQVHGGLNTSDIRMAVLRSPDRGGKAHPTRMSSTAREAADALDSAGIPWIHTVGYRKPTARDHFNIPAEHERLLPPSMASRRPQEPRTANLLTDLADSPIFTPHVAWQRPGGHGYLLTLDGTHNSPEGPWGKVADPEWGLSGARPVASFLARGYWEPADGVKADDVLAATPRGRQ